MKPHPFFETLDDNAPNQASMDACAEFIRAVDQLFMVPGPGQRP